LASLVAVLVARVASAKSPIVVSLLKTTQSNGGALDQPITSYYLNANIGIPPKRFRLLLDVNSREIWVPHYSKMGLVFNRLNYKNGYRGKDSKTSYKEEDQKYTIESDGCALTGKAYRDIFEFNDLIHSSLVPKFQQRFLAMSSASNGKFGDRGNVDGVITLNPWPISVTGSDLMSVNLVRSGAIDELKFGLSLEDDQSLESEAKYGGELTLGGISPTSFHAYSLESLRYHKVVSRYAWELPLDNVLLGAISVSGTSNLTGVVSTSHNEIYGPRKDVEQILILLGFGDEIGKDGFKTNKVYEIDCGKASTLPPIHMVIEGSYYTMKASSFIRKKTSGVIFKSEGCYVAILVNEASDNQWILGTNFLTNVYSVFDINSRKVGLMPRR